MIKWDRTLLEYQRKKVVICHICKGTGKELEYDRWGDLNYEGWCRVCSGKGRLLERSVVLDLKEVVPLGNEI